jgi:hypothetical protein
MVLTTRSAVGESRGRLVKVFLSHSFRPEDRHLVAKIDSLLGAQDVLVATGRRLGGAAITPEILRRIETTDA